MSGTESETSWVEKIGKPAAASLREMVAALECDYDRLEELRDEHKDLFEAANEAREAYSAYGTVSAEDTEGEAEAAELEKALEAASDALGDWLDDNEDDLKELAEAAGECADQDEARQRIEEDALSVQVRSDWVSPGEPMTPGEFEILLTTGGPAVRILGELDESGEPCRAWLEVQDWGKPWTEYYEPGLDNVLLAYARCFVYVV